MPARVLFSAEPGKVTEPTPRLHIEDARRHVGRLLGGGLFQSFNACAGVPARSNIADFISDLGEVNVGFDDMVTIEVGQDAKTVLGLDLVVGRPASGTNYERPIASNAAPARRDSLDGKSFGYVPLEGTVSIDMLSEAQLEVGPGQVLIPEDAQHRVHIPSGGTLLELILTQSTAGPACEAEWSAYAAAQPNPNAL